MSDQTVTLQKKSGFTAIEELVTMTKLFHNTYYSEKGGQWLFTRLDLKRLMSSGGRWESGSVI